MKKRTSLILIFLPLLMGCSIQTHNSKSNAIASLFENAKSSQSSPSSVADSSLISGNESSFESETQSSFLFSESAQIVTSEEIASVHSEITSEPQSSIEEVISGNKSSIAPIYDKVDVDLTKMNSTMVYAQVLNMLDDPGSYIGKIVKMSGPFIPFESTDPSTCYPAILISDATACCASGIEFILYGVPLCSMSGGNGYPLYQEEATIVGRFETYLEDASLYIHLVDAIWLK